MKKDVCNCGRPNCYICGSFKVIKRSMLIVACCLLMNSCELESRYTTVQHKEVIAKKYVEQECYNHYGAFRMNHYFLYESGTLAEVELDLYVASEVGDTIIVTESIPKN